MGFFRSWVMNEAVLPMTGNYSDWNMRSTKRAFSMSVAAHLATTSKRRPSVSLNLGTPRLFITSNPPKSSSLLLMGVAKIL